MVCKKKGSGVGFVGSALVRMNAKQAELVAFLLREFYEAGSVFHYKAQCPSNVQGTILDACDMAEGVGYKFVHHPVNGRVVEQCAVLVIAFKRTPPHLSAQWPTWKYARNVGRARIGILPNGMLYVPSGKVAPCG